MNLYKYLDGWFCKAEKQEELQQQPKGMAIVDSTPPTPKQRFNIIVDGQDVGVLRFNETAGKHKLVILEKHINTCLGFSVMHEYTQEEMEVILQKLKELNNG